MMNINPIIRYILFLTLCLCFGLNAHTYTLNQSKMTPFKLNNEGKIELTQEPFLTINTLQANRTQIPHVFDSNHLDTLINSFAKGGDISGSGNTLFYNGKRKLIDTFFMNQPESQLQLISSKSKKLIEIFHLTKTEINTLIQPIFYRLSKHYPSLSQILLKTYQQTPFYFIAGQFRFLDLNLYVDPHIEYPNDAKISTTALFIKNIGIIISKNPFFEMDSFNQTALIIHEILRTLQIQYTLQMRNSDIQSITAALMDPKADLNSVIINSSLKTVLLSPQEVSIMKDFKILLESIKNRYNIIPSVNPNIDHLSFFDVANISADVSLKLLQLLFEIRYKDTKFDKIKTLTEIIDFQDHLDLKVVEFRNYGIRKLHYNAIEGAMELSFSLKLNPVKEFISNCNQEWIESQKCSELYGKLKALIY